MEKFCIWFCYHEVSNWSPHARQRLEIKTPYSDADERLIELETFPEGINQWLMNKSNPMEDLTSQTMQPIEIHKQINSELYPLRPTK